MNVSCSLSYFDALQLNHKNQLPTIHPHPPNTRSMFAAASPEEVVPHVHAITAVGFSKKMAVRLRHGRQGGGRTTHPYPKASPRPPIQPTKLNQIRPNASTLL